MWLLGSPKHPWVLAPRAARVETMAQQIGIPRSIHKGTVRGMSNMEDKIRMSANDETQGLHFTGWATVVAGPRHEVKHTTHVINDQGRGAKLPVFVGPGAWSSAI